MKLLYPRKLLPTIKICVQLPVAGGVQQPTPFHFANAILLISLYYSSQFFSLPFTVRMQERIEPCHVFLFIFHLFLVGLSITKFAVWVIPLALCCQIGLGGQHINELKNSSLWGSLIKMSFRDSFLCGATSQLSQLPCFFMPTIFTVLACSTSCKPWSVPGISSPRRLYTTLLVMILMFLVVCLCSLSSAYCHTSRISMSPEGLCLLNCLLGWKLPVCLYIHCWLSYLGIIAVTQNLKLPNPGYLEFIDDWRHR